MVKTSPELQDGYIRSFAASISRPDKFVRQNDRKSLAKIAETVLGIEIDDWSHSMLATISFARQIDEPHYTAFPQANYYLDSSGYGSWMDPVRLADRVQAAHGDMFETFKHDKDEDLMFGGFWSTTVFKQRDGSSILVGTEVQKKHLIFQEHIIAAQALSRQLDNAHIVAVNYVPSQRAYLVHDGETNFPIDPNLSGYKKTGHNPFHRIMSSLCR